MKGLSVGEQPMLRCLLWPNNDVGIFTPNGFEILPFIIINKK